MINNSLLSAYKYSCFSSVFGYPILLFCFYRHPFPYPSGNHSPEEYEYAVASVDDGYPLFPMKCTDNVTGSLTGFHQHRVMLSVIQLVGSYKSRSDIGEVNV